MTSRKTHKQFVEEVELKYGSEFTVLEDYVTATTKIMIRHEDCGKEYMRTPNGFIRSGGCKFCGMKKYRKTHEQFVKEVESLVGDSYTILDKYENTRTPVRVKHIECGFDYSVKPFDFLQGRRCPVCSDSVSRTTRSFKKEIDILVGDEYSVLGEYVKNNVGILFKHNLCGETFEMAPSGFTAKGYRCPSCSIKNRTKSGEDFRKEIYEMVGDEYTFLEEYVNARKPLKVRHNDCGNEYMAKPRKFLEGSFRCGNCREFDVDFQKYIDEHANSEYEMLEKYNGSGNKILIKHITCGYTFKVIPNNFMYKMSRCPMCAGVRVSHEMFEQKFNKALSGEYELLGRYKNAKTKIKVEHIICGHKYEVIPNQILGGSRCPKCQSVSIGEELIDRYLSKTGLKYTSQFKTALCKNTNRLPFDFAIFDEDNILTLLIEYDGIQHFEPVEYFGGESSFEIIKRHDSIKDNFCKHNSIPLLRIPYWDKDDIEYILFNELEKIGVLETITV